MAPFLERSIKHRRETKQFRVGNYFRNDKKIEKAWTTGTGFDHVTEALFVVKNKLLNK